MNELTEIANNCRTDKGTTIHEGHNFTEFYYDYFKKLKDTKEKVYILEIGIYHGGSLKMYNEFFEHNCEIYAIDINLGLNYYKDENVHLYQMDINNKTKLNDFLEEVKDISFDFILDDASHRFSDQYISLFSLYHKLKPNGKFILEDLHTWTWENEQDSPLRFLNFYEPNRYVSKEQIESFRKDLKNCIIYINNNKNGLYGNNTSSTAIISFN